MESSDKVTEKLVEMSDRLGEIQEKREQKNGEGEEHDWAEERAQDEGGDGGA